MTDAYAFHAFVKQSLMLKSRSVDGQISETNDFINQMLISHGTVQNIKNLLKIDNDFDLLCDIQQLVKANEQPFTANQHFKAQVAQALGIRSILEQDILERIMVLQRCKVGVVVPINGANADFVGNEVLQQMQLQCKTLQNNFQEICIDNLLFSCTAPASFEQVVCRLHEIAHTEEELSKYKNACEQQASVLKQITTEENAEAWKTATGRLQHVQQQVLDLSSRITNALQQRIQLEAQTAHEQAKLQQAQRQLEKSEMERDDAISKITTMMVQLQKRDDQIHALETQLDEFKRLVSQGIL